MTTGAEEERKPKPWKRYNDFIYNRTNTDIYNDVYNILIYIILYTECLCDVFHKQCTFHIFFIRRNQGCWWMDRWQKDRWEPEGSWDSEWGSHLFVVVLIRPLWSLLFEWKREDKREEKKRVRGKECQKWETDKVCLLEMRKLVEFKAGSLFLNTVIKLNLLDEWFRAYMCLSICMYMSSQCFRVEVSSLHHFFMFASSVTAYWMEF